MTILYADTETFSPVDLFKAGTHRYADEAEVMLFGYAIDDGPSQVWDLTTGAPMPKALANTLHDTEVMTVWQNSHFDRTVLRKAMGINLPVERIHDTMVQAFTHSLPGALGKLGVILGLPEEQQKDKRGKQLIQLFCKPRPKNTILRRATRETNPEEWAEFIEYLHSDVISMREIYKRMPVWNYQGKELELWRLDQKINDRGFAVDVQLAEAAIRAAHLTKESLKQQVQDETDGQVTAATKRDQMLKYILQEHGVDLPDMKMDTLKRRMEDPELPDAVRLLIAIRLEASSTSHSKYNALVKSVSPDGRLRNTMQFAGALRTQRWAGRIFQPHNMKRPDKDMKPQIPMLIEATKHDLLDVVEKSPMRALANIVRGCIIAPPGRKLVISDLSNIEGRGLAWLAGEHWKLKAFADIDEHGGADMYMRSYAQAFGIDAAMVDDYMRQVGKVMELGLGYQGGVGAFITFAAVYNMDLDALAKVVWATADGPALHDAGRLYDWTVKVHRSTFGLTRETWVACQVLVTAWREAHPATVGLWNESERAVRSAIRNPGNTFSIGEHLKVRRDGAWLRVRLPSGRYLCYMNPSCEPGDKGKITYMGVSAYSRQWKRISSYGGKFVENFDQAMSRDAMAYTMPSIEAAGYPIVLHTHDEIAAETPDEDEYTSDELSRLLATNQPWNLGLPLHAKGFETDRYKKD